MRKIKITPEDLEALGSQELKIEIPAYDPVNDRPGTFDVDATGNAFYLIDCTGEVRVKVDSSPFKTFRKSTGESYPRQQYFERLEFQNWGAKTTVVLWVGWGKYEDRRFELLEAPTKATGWDDPNQHIPAMSHVDFVPKSGNGFIRRKAIIVTNLDPNENLRITDTAGNPFMTVFPRTSVTLPVTNTIRIKNDTGAAIDCNVGEIDYIENNLISVAS